MGLLASGPHGGCKLVSDITSENEPNSLGPTTHGIATSWNTEVCSWPVLLRCFPWTAVTLTSRKSKIRKTFSLLYLCAKERMT